jgi:lipoprotein-anchoring transpeptidase ErfK/SrfK
MSSQPVTYRGRHTHIRARRHSKAWLWVLIGCLAIAGLTAGGLALTGQFILAHRAPLGASFAGQSVAGQTEAQLHQVVARAADHTRLTVTASDSPHVHTNSPSRSATFTYAQLGAKPDIDRTVSRIVESKGSNPIVRAWPWSQSSTPLSISLPSAQSLQNTLNTRLVDVQRQKIIAPSAFYDSHAHRFTLNPGQNGQKVSIQPVEQALSDSGRHPGSLRSISTTYVPLPPAISPDAMNQAVTQANNRLDGTYAITAGSQRYTIPRDQLAQWISIPTPAKGVAPTPVINTKAAQQWISSTVPSQLKIDAIPEASSTDSKGTTILRHHGSDGLAITSVQTAAQQISQALQEGHSQTSAAQTSPITHGTQKLDAPGLQVQKGHWVLVDLSAQTVSAYNDSNLVNVYPMASGKTGHETPTGSDYTVSLKADSQTMRGPGYVTPGVKWVSYFYEDYALHAAPWNLWNIAIGHPSSHGCVNMVPADAKAIYDFAPSGTHVEVIGSPTASTARPTKSVAAAEAWVNGKRSA